MVTSRAVLRVKEYTASGPDEVVLQAPVWLFEYEPVLTVKAS